MTMQIVLPKSGVEMKLFNADQKPNLSKPLAIKAFQWRLKKKVVNGNDLEDFDHILLSRYVRTTSSTIP